MYVAIALSSADAMRRDIPVIAPRSPLDAALRLMQESAARRSAWQRDFQAPLLSR
jgi:CBS domain-containing protein